MKNKLFRFSIFLIVGVFLLTGLNFSAQKGKLLNYDVLIKNASVFDGSLKPAFRADVAVKDGMIVKVERSIKGSAAKVINGKGLYVTPGFIDLHTHVDKGMYFAENRACLNYLKQGVTTVIVGQCGASAWPIFEKAEYLVKVWSEEGIGPNAALLIGHGTVRQIVMGMEEREPTAEELEKMKALVKEAMEQGAHGFSTGLIYQPGSFAKTDEVIELVKVIAPYGGIYHSHIRDEKDKLLEAVKEAIKISDKSGAPAHISHLKVMRKKNWGLVREACAIIEEAQAKGIKVTADQYPYKFPNGYPYMSPIPGSAWLGIEETETEGRGRVDTERLTSEDIEAIFNHLRDSQLIELYKKVTPYYPVSKRHLQFLNEIPRNRLVRLVSGSLISPGNFRGPGRTKERSMFLKRMANPEEAQKIRQQIREYIDDVTGPGNFIVGICIEKNLEGRSLKQIAAMKGKSIEDTAIELELMGALCVPLMIGEEDIEYIMKKDYVGTGSDGDAYPYGIGLTHIRSYSTFLHKIKKYALKRKSVSVSHVIRSQTSLPAKIMNWDDRGWVKNGYKADIVVLDLNNIKTGTSISNPHVYSKGVKYLLINGEVVLDGGKWTGKLPGKVIKLKK